MWIAKMLCVCAVMALFNLSPSKQMPKGCRVDSGVTLSCCQTNVLLDFHRAVFRHVSITWHCEPWHLERVICANFIGTLGGMSALNRSPRVTCVVNVKSLQASNARRRPQVWKWRVKICPRAIQLLTDCICQIMFCFANRYPQRLLF